ncbi:MULTISPECIES: hypothetical protein [unclassified Methylobacterium]
MSLKRIGATAINPRCLPLVHWLRSILARRETSLDCQVRSHRA